MDKNFGQAEGCFSTFEQCLQLQFKKILTHLIWFSGSAVKCYVGVIKGFEPNVVNTTSIVDCGDEILHCTKSQKGKIRTVLFLLGYDYVDVFLFPQLTA